VSGSYRLLVHAACHLMVQRVSVAESVRVKTYEASVTPLARSQPPTAKASYAFTTLQRRAASAALPVAAM
jgi:hypothetical protein